MPLFKLDDIVSINPKCNMDVFGIIVEIRGKERFVYRILVSSDRSIWVPERHLKKRSG